MRIPATLSMLALLPLSGCQVGQNARITLGQDVHLEALDPVSAGSGSIVPPLESQELADAAVGFVEEDEIPGRGVILLAPVPTPSLAGADRAGWDRQVFFVPVDHTFHHPTYTLGLDYTPRGEHPVGAYPTALSGVAVPSGGIRNQIAETLATPFVAAANSFLIVPWLFVERPWKLDFSPEEPYERYWQQRDSLPVEPADAPPPPTQPDEQPAPANDLDPAGGELR